jgi:beta-galactosidase
VDHDPFLANQRKLYDGNAVAILRATASSGAIKVTASADGLPTATLTLSTAPMAQEDPAVAQATAGRSF